MLRWMKKDCVLWVGEWVLGEGEGGCDSLTVAHVNAYFYCLGSTCVLHSLLRSLLAQHQDRYAR